ncbi:hypothetical protein [Streptomyces sp. NPDC058295]|uniref:hypothetical protein n=1 Tax=Streptomyces sp. NPDC058295 TaxID=3346431 RepID=UPI0036EBCCEF
MIAAAVHGRETTDAELLQQALEPVAQAVGVGPQSIGWPTSPSWSTAGQHNKFLPRSMNCASSIRISSCGSAALQFVDTSQQAEGGTAEASGTLAAQPNGSERFGPGQA